MKANDTTTPVDITVDCACGHVTAVPLTPAQIAAQQAAAAQQVQQAQAAATARQQLVSAVAASTDPALLALAKLWGVIQ